MVKRRCQSCVLFLGNAGAIAPRARDIGCRVGKIKRRGVDRHGIATDVWSRRGIKKMADQGSANWDFSGIKLRSVARLNI